MPPAARRLPVALLCLVVALPLVASASPAPPPAAPAADDQRAPTAASVTSVQTFIETDSPACLPLLGGGDVTTAPYFADGDCGYTRLALAGVPEGAAVTAVAVGPVGEPRDLDVTADGDGGHTVAYALDDTFPVGDGELQVRVDGEVVGTTPLYHNALAATLEVDHTGDLAPGDPLPVSGVVEQVSYGTGAEAIVLGDPARQGVPATFSLQVRSPEGEVVGDPVPVRADADGTFTATIPAGATAGLAPTDGDATLQVAVEAVDATHDDAGTTWAAARAGTTPATLAVEPTELALDASFVSSTGWVKPGDGFPFRVTVTNATGAAVDDATVTIAAPDAVTFTDAQALGSAPAPAVSDTAVTWTLPTVAPGTPDVPTVQTLVVQATAADLATDPRVVWKDLSVTATLAASGHEASATTHGPKVIPPTGGFETARYGDKPFPIVPVDYVDRRHEDAHTGDELSRVVNSPDVPGSTFNLYQEMSYGQLFPVGTVPSSGMATADFGYEHGFDFSHADRTTGTCRGYTMADLGPSSYGTALYPDRIVDGWYQLPGTTEYYGGDWPAFTLGTGSTIDGACGPTGKAVYDAAAIADPEIDYADYDSDKDGVVDFFMMVFTGRGGNGDSQINGLPPYDNIWPHSSSLELDFVDPDTGLRGYVSDDQLTSDLGVPQCWVDASRTRFDDCAAAGGEGDDALPTFVRVGPYNVNPESAIDAASVISHEYGHHLGLPDFYSGGATGNPYYDSMNLMASDHSQHMTVFGKQELGWVVPQVVQPGEQVTVDDWSEIKTDIGRIEWQTPDGTPYTLVDDPDGPRVRNGQAYTVKLPQERVIDPAKVADQASAPYVFWSGRGNDFGCSPTGGHNMDLLLPELADVPADAEVELSFRSNFDIEWDWDYGFVLTSTDGDSFTSVPSSNGTTTSSAFNPNAAGCLDELDNGLTGTSTAHAQGEPFVTAARNPVAPDYAGDHPFITDSYDISSLAGQDGARVRFSYFTDAAFDRPGWFVDDVVVTVDGEEVVRVDGEDDVAGRILQGGCGDVEAPVDQSATCTAGWSRIDASDVNPADHGYYLELRDRALFDFDGNGQSDRGAPDWEAGVFVEVTDESHGYGNNGVPPPPSQHYLDSVPEPGAGCDTTTCEDSAFRAVAGRNHFDDSSQDGGWVDNHADDEADDGLWRFAHDCLSLDVTDMSGEGAGPGAPDLVADAVIRAGEGCREFAYSPSGGDTGTTAPTAAFTHRPSTVRAGVPVTFDGSGSSDDQQTPGQLQYAWDLDGDGAHDDADRQVVTHTFDTPGTVRVGLQVTDADGLTGTTTRTVVVEAGDRPPEPEGPPPAQPSRDGVERRFGADRVGTSVALSRGAFPVADTAVLARADAFPDALAAATLAAEVRGPILLTGSDDLDPRVADELDRLGVREVLLVGGQVALSDQVRVDLEDVGIRARRVSGSDRYATAAAIAREVVRRGGSVDGAIVALGDRADGRDAFPDALAASQLATRTRRPVLLVTPDRVPDATRQALDDVLADDATVTIAGGTVAIGREVEEDLGAARRRVTRVSGADRYATAAELADAALTAGASGDQAWVVSGTAFPDALAAGPAAWTSDAVVLLTDPATLSDATGRWLSSHADELHRAVVVGGTAALDERIDAQVGAAMR